jgi:hypothetical protein
MRPLRLARIAAEAEGLRLRYAAKRAATRAIIGVIALAFLLGAVTFCHFAIWFWLRRSWEPPSAALIMAGGDLVLALAFGLLAARSSPSQIEREALEVRKRALESATSGLAVSAIATQLLRLAVNLVRRSRA